MRRGGEEDEEEEEEEEEDDDGMEGEELGGEIVPLKEQLRCCCQQLSELHWLPLIESTLSSTLHAHLLAKLHRRCKGNFEERMLHSMLDWLDATVTSWLRVVLQPAAPEAPPSSALQQWQVRLRYFIMQSLAALRTTELFDIIIDFPDSLPAVSDLKECLQHTHQHAQVVSALSDYIDQRLLKPGTDTSKIIQVYVAAIKALRHLDPSGGYAGDGFGASEGLPQGTRRHHPPGRRAPCPLLLSFLPAASFLPRCFFPTPLLPPDPAVDPSSLSTSPPPPTSPPSTSPPLQKVVTSLTDPETSELLEPNSSGGGDDGLAAGLEDETLDVDELKGDEAAMLLWAPDPVQADPMRSSFSRRSSDVLSILVRAVTERLSL